MQELNLTNQLLIAMPTLLDPNFHQTVTYICAHNEEGAMGIVINRPMSIALGEVLEQLELRTDNPDIEKQIVYQGGPVQKDRGFILYPGGGEWDSSIPISDRIAVATSRDILEAIAQGRGPQETLIALGYAGWGAGQLEQEISENAWLVAPLDEEILFRLPHEQRWEAAAALVGVDLRQISDQIGHA
ncbi:MAG: YqgE/AlgH family protein [Gammaproteobacteria bacterium]|nr:MAG: YqgE/AlgH family protein [Gammaproteobacteria bacterium]